MNFTNRMAIIALPAAVDLGLLLSTASLGWKVPSVQTASGPIDAQATEIVRLINRARGTDGKPALIALGAGSGAAFLAAWSALLMLRRRRAAFGGAT